MLSGGLLFWQSQAAPENEIPVPPPPKQLANGLPEPGAIAPAFGPAPPTPPVSEKTSREDARFNHYDRNRYDIISRIEMMNSPTKAFKNLDKDGNILLTLQEWAVATSKRFAEADGNGNGLLKRMEFAKTRPKAAAKTKCRC